MSVPSPDLHHSAIASAAIASLPETASVVDQTVASVRTEPDSLLIIVGDQATVTARALNRAGEALSRSVNWTVQTAALVTILSKTGSALTFKAKKTGITTIRAGAAGKADTTKLVIRGSAGSRVLLSPESASVATRGTVQFAAAGRTSTGETATITATWSATGGTVSSSGVYVAGTVPGPTG